MPSQSHHPLVRRLLTAFVAVALIAGACGGGDAADTALPTTAPTDAPPTATSVPAPPTTERTPPPTTVVVPDPTPTPEAPPTATTEPTATAIPTPVPGHAQYIDLGDGRFGSLTDDGESWEWEPITDQVLTYPAWENGLSEVTDPAVALAIYTAIMQVSGGLTPLATGASVPAWDTLVDRGLLSPVIRDDSEQRRQVNIDRGDRDSLTVASVHRVEANTEAKGVVEVLLCLHAIIELVSGDEVVVAPVERTVHRRVAFDRLEAGAWVLTAWEILNVHEGGYIDCQASVS